MMADDADVLKMDSLSYQRAVIGSMLIDDRCVGAVLAKLAPEDFSDGPCRSAYRAIKGQFLAGLPVDPVLIQGKIGGGEAWARWAAELMQETPTAANAEFYADEVRKWANFWRQREQAGKILSALTPDESDQLARGMAGLVGTNSRGFPSAHHQPGKTGVSPVGDSFRRSGRSCGAGRRDPAGRVRFGRQDAAVHPDGPCAGQALQGRVLHAGDPAGKNGRPDICSPCEDPTEGDQDQKPV